MRSVATSLGIIWIPRYRREVLSFWLRKKQKSSLATLSGALLGAGMISIGWAKKNKERDRVADTPSQTTRRRETLLGRVTNAITFKPWRKWVTVSFTSHEKSLFQGVFCAEFAIRRFLLAVYRGVPKNAEKKRKITLWKSSFLEQFSSLLAVFQQSR